LNIYSRVSITLSLKGIRKILIKKEFTILERERRDLKCLPLLGVPRRESGLHFCQKLKSLGWGKSLLRLQGYALWVIGTSCRHNFNIATPLLSKRISS